MDFAMTRSEVDAVIRVARSSTTKAILILASHGYTAREITTYRYADIAASLDKRLVGLRPEYYDCLQQFPNGFNISTVAVWRRTKKALTKAAELGVVKFNPERIPFPQALRFTKDDDLHIREKVIEVAKRIHYLNGGLGDTRDPLTACPHIDCQMVRELLIAVDQERVQRR